MNSTRSCNDDFMAALESRTKPLSSLAELLSDFSMHMLARMGAKMKYLPD